MEGKCGLVRDVWHMASDRVRSPKGGRLSLGVL